MVLEGKRIGSNRRPRGFYAAHQENQWRIDPLDKEKDFVGAGKEMFAEFLIDPGALTGQMVSSEDQSRTAKGKVS